MENINVSFPNDSLGDPLRDAFIKVNDNFSELDITKVDKELGKGLSSEDFTSAEKSKLAALPTNPEILTNKQNNLLIDGTGIKYATIDAVNSHALNTANPHNVIAPQVAAGAHGVFLTSLTTQGQLDNTETQLIVEQKTSKISYRASYQTGLARPDADTSVLTISPADTLTITNVNGVLFVNEVFPDTPLNKLVDFVKDFGNKSFVANGTNTPLAANTRGIFYVGIDKTGTQVYKTSRAFDLDVSLLARILVANTAGVYSIVSFKYYPNLMSTDPTDRGRSVSAGGYIVPSGAASISFGNRSMFLKKDSVNYDVNKLDPHYKTIVDSVNPTPMNFLFLLPNITDLSTSIALSTTMNPTQWYTAGGTVGVGAVNPTHYQVYRLMLTVTGTIAIQTLASTVSTPVPGVNAIFGTREEALAGLTSVVFPPVFPAGDAQPLGTFYLRAGTNPNGSELTNSNDFYFRPVGSSSSSSTVGVTAHDTLTGKNDNANFYHPTLAQVTSWDNHIANVANPHNVTKAQVGLGNVDNTSDLDKPISNATQAALNTKTDKATLINTTSPLQGGGDLSANRTLSILQASASQSGFLSSTDWQLFNSRVGGALTASYVAKATGTNTLANSVIFDNGTYVGIGTNAPSSLLNIRSGTEGAYFRAVGVNDGDNYGALELWNTAATSKWQFAHKSAGSGLDKDFQFAHYNGTSWSFPLHIKTGGNVGIGTTAPTQKLHVAGSVLATSFIKNGATASNILLAGGGDIPQSTFAPSSGSGSYIQNQNASAQSANMWIDGSGKFGNSVILLGGNPQITLDSQASNVANKQSNLLFTKAGTALWQVHNDINANNGQTFGIKDNVANINRFVIDSNGNVGIGTTSPSDKLHVAGNIFADAFNSVSGLTQFNSTGGVAIAGLAGSAYAYITAYSDAGGTGKNLSLQKDGGKVLINTVTTNGVNGDRLQVNGGITATRINQGDYINDLITNSFKSSGSAGSFHTYFVNTNPANDTYGLGINVANTSNTGHIFETVSGGLSRFYVRNDGVVAINNPLTANQYFNVNGMIQSIDSKNQYLKMGMENDTAVISTDWFSGYSGSSRPMAFYTGGAQRMIIGSAGNIGVNTTAPTGLFHVAGMTNVSNIGNTSPSIGGLSGGFNVSAGGTTDSYGLQMGAYGSGIFWMQSQTNAGSPIVYPIALNPAGGSVLVNTITDNGYDKLQVGGSLSAGYNSVSKLGLFYAGNDFNGYPVGGYNVRYINANTFKYDGFDSTAFIHYADRMHFHVAPAAAGGTQITGSLKMSLLPNGNLLVGTTSDAGTRIHTAGALGGVVGNGASAIRMTNTDTGNYASISAGVVAYSNAGMEFSLDGIQRMAIWPSSNVTIGALDNGIDKLQVNGDIKTRKVKTDSGHGVALGASFEVGATDGSRFFIYNTGLSRDDLTINPSTGAATFAGTVTAAGGFFNSDARLKDVISRDGDVVKFKWKDGRDDKTHVGLIAQEVQEYMPDAVQEGEDGMLSVNYIEVLVTKIAQLEKEIKELKSKLN